MVLLSFDTEEFDVPKEKGYDISIDESMKVSVSGTTKILDCLKAEGVRATFFCTGVFAEHAPEVIERIKAEGHEVACHGVDHWQPKPSDVEQSKAIIERVAGVKACGYRQPRMFPVSDSDIAKAGYRYNSSLNPAFIPGKYMHLTEPRTWFWKEGVMQIPASVTPLVRFPLFWLAMHLLPMPLYLWMIRRVLRHDGYFVTYFHPWEFYALKEHPEWKTLWIVRHNSGTTLEGRLHRLIGSLKSDGEEFITFSEFVARQEKGGRQ